MTPIFYLGQRVLMKCPHFGKNRIGIVVHGVCLKCPKEEFSPEVAESPYLFQEEQAFLEKKFIHDSEPECFCLSPFEMELTDKGNTEEMVRERVKYLQKFYKENY